MKRILYIFPLLILFALPGLLPIIHATPAELPERCEHCGVPVTWQKLTEEDSDSTTLGPGHYYLAYDAESWEFSQKTVTGNVCLYLNGKTYIGQTRAFRVSGTLSVMGEGTVTGCGTTETGTGGTIEIISSGRLNLYGGTITSYLPEGEITTVNGGAVHVRGDFYMYGGTIRDGIAYNTGNNVFVTTEGRFCCYGGRIEGGGEPGDSVVSRGLVELSGNGDIACIWLFPKADGPALEEMLTVKKAFAGNAALFIKDNAEGMDIGSAEGDFSGTLSVKNTSYIPIHSNGQLILKGSSPAMVAGETTAFYPTVTQAIEACGDGEVVLLSSAEADITVSRDTRLDLNGCSLTGSITGSGTLFCRDSQTEDYTIADNICGSISASDCLAPQEGYLMLENEGKQRFHRLNLEITGTALRTDVAGIYFTGAFAGDEAIKAELDSFGIAASVLGDPLEMPESAIYTSQGPEDFSTGAEHTGALIRNIMKQENSADTNAIYAAMPIYGRAYVQLKNGQILYGSCRSRSLQQQLEYTDLMWSATTVLQQSKLVEFYRTYENLMADWDLSKLPTVRQQLNEKDSPLAQLQTLEERRDAVEAYMRHQVTLLWQVSEPITYSFKVNSGDPEIDAENYIATLLPGRIYCGIPYTHGSGNAETFIDIAAPGNDGVYTFSQISSQMISGGGSYEENNRARIGNNCADSVFWAWARVSATATFPNSFNMTPANGCLPVGDYETVADDAVKYTLTGDITSANGEETMFRAYSQMQKGDAMVLVVSGGGHAILVSDVHVVLKNGQIDPDQSYILYHDQTSKYLIREVTRYDERVGQDVYVAGGYNNKYTFRQLYSKKFLPVTCRELIDPAPLPEEQVYDSVEVRTGQNLFSGVIYANYRIAEVTVGISDALGHPMQQCTRYVPEKEMYRCDISAFTQAGEAPVLQGGVDLSCLVPGSYTCVISCRLSTGLEMIVREFSFTIDG